MGEVHFVDLFRVSLAIAGIALSGENVMAQEESPGELIETFVLSPAMPARSFLDNQLEIELVSATADDLMKTIKIRVSSRALRAEYGNRWQEHTYLEMLKGYLGSPISGSPFKCAEGWLYYEKSGSEGVTLSLKANPHMSDRNSYGILLLLLENWKRVVVALGFVALAFFLYYYTPLILSFITIQHQAHTHAQMTGFPSYPVLVYLIQRLPLLLVVFLFFRVLFDYGWKGMVVSAAIAIGLQLYLNWHNARQLRTYASLKGLVTTAGSKDRAFHGQIDQMPLALAVGGTFLDNPYYSGDLQSGSNVFYMSFMFLEVTLRHSRWDGLVLLRGTKTNQWTASRSIDRFPRINQALAAISRLSRFSILRLEVSNGKLATVKAFAPDTPAEIHLLVDLVADVARALNEVRP